MSVCASAAAIAGDLALRSGAVAVARVAQEPAKPQPGQLGHARDHLGGAAALGIDPAAMKADVHLHQHVDLALFTRIKPDQPRATSRSSTMNESRVRSSSLSTRSALAGLIG